MYMNVISGTNRLEIAIISSIANKVGAQHKFDIVTALV